MDPNAPSPPIWLYVGAAALVGVVLLRGARAPRWEYGGEFVSTPESRARRGHKRPVSKVAKVAASRARRSDDDDLARRLERGEIRGEELAALMKSGQLARKRNPSEPGDLEAAKALSLKFHGQSDHVAILDAEERRPLPKYVMVLGEQPEIQYEPLDGSNRDNTIWEHAAGDRGPGVAAATFKPLLVIDPTTMRPAMILHKSPMRLDKSKGLVG